jgi:hypothetical protein
MSESEQVVRVDLTAAKALIDTPEKLAAVGDVSNALSRVVGDGALSRLEAMQRLLDRKSSQRLKFLRSKSLTYIAFCRDPRTQHSDIMALFDRAIAASPPTPSGE